MSDKLKNLKKYMLFKKGVAFSLAAVLLSFSSLTNAVDNSIYSDDCVGDDAGPIEMYDDGSYVEGTVEEAIDIGGSTSEYDYIDSDDESFEYDSGSDFTGDVVKDAARGARNAAIEASHDDD